MSVTAKEIAQRLASRVESFAPFLLPNGKRVGTDWCVGGIGGESGKSLKVRLSGPKAGVWSDFASQDQKGDLLDLICAIKGVMLRDAIRFAKDYLGIAEVQNAVPKKQWKQPPTAENPTPSGKTLEYLRKERGLTVETIMAYRMSQQSDKKNGDEYVFLSYASGKDGPLLNRKYVAVKRDARGKKITRQESGCPPSLFGWQAIDHEARETIIQEGELDAMTWYQVGFPALSVPMGAGNHQWIDYEWDNLEQFDTIYLCYDDDHEGQEGVIEVAKRLGTHRCLIVRLPHHKDPNEALVKGKKPKEYFFSAITSAKPLTPAHIKTPPQFREKVHQRFYPSAGVVPGYFPQLLYKRLGMRPGELTVWTGIAGHGKSVLLSQLTIGALLFGMKAAIASMEMKGEQTLQKMICQSETTDLPLPGVIDSVLDWLAGKLWVYDLMGEVSADLLLDLMQYSYARSGVNFYTIDSLMKCNISSEDYEAQRKFLNRLSCFAKDTGSHVNLVAHARKGRDESNAPGKMDVRGTGDIINQADNILTTWRNKEKEELREDGKLSEKEESGIPDTIVYCNKQRESGEEFKSRLMFSKKCSRFYRMGDEFHENLSIIRRINEELNDTPQMSL